MKDEENLASARLQPALSGLVGSTQMAQAARTGPQWMRRLMKIFIVITLVATGAGIFGNLAGIGSIPACDEQKTRDTLSDLNKQNKFNASKYNFIKNVATTDSETTCTANLALWGGGTVEYDYRIFKEDSKVKVQITNVRR
jgi:hypothetical protein